MPLRDRPGLTAVERIHALLPDSLTSAVGWTPTQDLSEQEPVSIQELLKEGRWDPGRQGALALVLVAVLAAIIAVVVVVRGHPTEQPLTVPHVVTSTTVGPELIVDVAGKVRHPGLVHLHTGARVDDAIRAAGGVLPGTSTGALNLAAKVDDGQQVLVGADPVGQASGAAQGALLDLNTATSQDFDALPGIGPVLADRIVAWRTQHGRFGSVDQLREVSGIGESKFQQLKAKVRV